MLRVIRSHHFWGLLGTGLVMYFVIFGPLAKVNVGWIMPDTQRMARNLLASWPRMPFFAVTKRPAPNGHGEVIYYTVPTRQFTPRELTEMGVTNATAHPSEPNR